MNDSLNIGYMREKLKDFDVILYSGNSTMDYAEENSVEKSTIVMSEFQSGGKGRLNRRFVSKKGGLYMSIILKRVDTKRFAIISALAVSDALDYYKIDNLIKWPNDIFCNNKKICGILIKTNLYKSLINIGIGINVNNDMEDIKDVAISTKALGYDIKIEDLAVKITECLTLIEKEPFESILTRYKSKCLNILNKSALDIDNNGYLVDTEGNRHLNPNS